MHIRKNSLNFFRYKPRKWQKTCTFDIFLSPKHAFFHTFSFFLPFSMTLPPDNKKLKNSLICLVFSSLIRTSELPLSLGIPKGDACYHRDARRYFHSTIKTK